jgi:hypothetical protein
MLSTAQARLLFEELTSCLAILEAKADTTPAGAASCLRVDAIIAELCAGLASPLNTWQKLLQHKVCKRL